jgi:CBS domain-containing protein
MQERGIRRLAVLAQQKRLVGVVSLDDIALDAGETRRAGTGVQRAAESAERER